jgi:hypothetical protein
LVNPNPPEAPVALRGVAPCSLDFPPPYVSTPAPAHPARIRLLSNHDSGCVGKQSTNHTKLVNCAFLSHKCPEINRLPTFLQLSPTILALPASVLSPPNFQPHPESWLLVHSNRASSACLSTTRTTPAMAPKFTQSPRYVVMLPKEFGGQRLEVSVRLSLTNSRPYGR